MISKALLNILRGANRRINKPDWTNLRNTTPISDVFGYDRGTQSIHRYYIDKFIEENGNKVKGKVLEVGDSTYMDKYKEQITLPRIITYRDTGQPNSFVGDLTNLDALPPSKFDCFICTQTFNFIYDFKTAIRGAAHVLNKNGFLIATVSGIQQISQYDASRWGDYWRFTKQSSANLFSEVFGKGNVSIKTYGNVLSSVAALEGLTSIELNTSELNFHDPNYEVIIGILAKKQG
jgi:hypothetical protein